MILNNTLILTLQDFRRHFSFDEFWVRRKHFIRDLEPGIFFYDNQKDVEYYNLTCKWIIAEGANNITEVERQNGLQALSALLNQNISMEELSTVLVSLNFNDDIICVPAGKTINLPGNIVNSEYPRSHSERLHKIEVQGNIGEAKILIGGSFAGNISIGECLYVTEINGAFMRILPNIIQRGSTILKIINKPGKFTSTLEITRYDMGKHVCTKQDVTQFRLEGMRIFCNSDNFLTI